MKRRVGKRTRKRMAMNARLKKMAIERGITQCELRLPGCLKSFALSWAHAKKSRFLITDEDWMEACLACAHCHQKIESLPHEEMARLVREAILKR